MAQHTGDISADIPQHTDDTPGDILRLTVPDAAQALGISPEAVRNRLSRGTLESIKEDGTVYVLLQADKVRYTGDTPNDGPRHTGDIPTDIPGESEALISAKDETIRVLTEQLEAERAANAEMRRIVAGLVQRVPQLEAPGEAPESPVSSSEGRGSSSTPPEQEKRSWLARFFGL